MTAETNRSTAETIENKETPNGWIPEMTPEQIEELALGLVQRKVFLADVGTEDFRSAFRIARRMGPLTYMGACAAWEYLSLARPMAVNGCPIFMSVNFVHADSMGPVLEKVREIEAALPEGARLVLPSSEELEKARQAYWAAAHYAIHHELSLSPDEMPPPPGGWPECATDYSDEIREQLEALSATAAEEEE